MIAVIGCNGQLGSELVKQGGKLGLDMVCADMPQIDIADRASIDRQIGSRALSLVVNAAAYTAVDRAESEPEAAFAINQLGPAHLADFCGSKAVPLIHISTDYVFDGNKKGAYIESDPVSPLGVYGKSKAAGEDDVHRRLECHIIIRTAWLYGTHGHNFVKTMLQLGRERKRLEVVADQAGCPTYAGDLAGALLKIASRIVSGESVEWGIYHYCGAGSTTWHGFTRAIFDIAGSYEKLIVEEVVPITTAQYPTPAKRPLNSVLDCSKIERHFGIRPRPWKESLTEMLAALYASAKTAIF
jgi:dTDP-4-dehydrorhamnose reductase